MKENKNIKIVIFQLLKIDKNFKYGAPGMGGQKAIFLNYFNNIEDIKLSMHHSFLVELYHIDYFHFH